MTSDVNADPFLSLSAVPPVYCGGDAVGVCYQGCGSAAVSGREVPPLSVSPHKHPLRFGAGWLWVGYVVLQCLSLHMYGVSYCLLL